MPYGNGSNWTGQVAQTGLITFEARFTGSASSVDFNVTNGQTTQIVVENLKNAWNATFPYEATVYNDATGKPVMVAFQRDGKVQDEMWVEGAQTTGREKVPKGAKKEVVSGLFVEEKDIP